MVELGWFLFSFMTVELVTLGLFAGFTWFAEFASGFIVD